MQIHFGVVRVSGVPMSLSFWFAVEASTDCGGLRVTTSVSSVHVILADASIQL